MGRKNAGMKIKEAVKESGFTQSAFERKIGLAANIISRWASGDRNPSLSSIKKVAKATGYPLNYFIDDKSIIVSNNKGRNIVVGESNIINDHESELLRKENELLMKEIDLLRQELKIKNEQPQSKRR